MVERLDALLAQGSEEIVEALFREALGTSDEELSELRAQPSWPARIAAAHTTPPEGRVEVEGALDPELAADITVPTLLLTGEDSPAFLTKGIETLAAVLPDAHVLVLEDQEHIADIVAPGRLRHVPERVPP